MEVNNNMIGLRSVTRKDQLIEDAYDLNVTIKKILRSDFYAYKKDYAMHPFLSIKPNIDQATLALSSILE